MSIAGAADPHGPRVNSFLQAYNMGFEIIIDLAPQSAADDTSLLDVYLLLKPGLRIAGRGEVYSQDIAVPIEHDFSINVSDAKEQVEWSLKNILRQDARRLFAYGINVVNSKMIAGTMATKVLAYLAFASCEELVFDTTLRSMLLSDSKVAYYLFMVEADDEDTYTDDADDATTDPDPDTIIGTEVTRIT
ncbi:hypothetical protein FRB97_002424 [Tulasnella sp. 331]|nr:hypothetical protein FRB97_002424 [Tulasnella sp. 331]